MQQAPCSLPGLRKVISTGTLWKQQVCAMAKLRFLKLRRERKILLSLLLILGIPFTPIIFEKIVDVVSNYTHCWELSSSMYFLSLKQPSQAPLTSLLVISNTGSNIEDFMQALKPQDIFLEVGDFRNRNGSGDPSYNGAIIMSGDWKVCFELQNVLMVDFGSLNGPLFLLVLANCISPYIGMSSIRDCKISLLSLNFLSSAEFEKPSLILCMISMPFYTLIGFFMFLVKVSNITHCVTGLNHVAH